VKIAFDCQSLGVGHRHGFATYVWNLIRSLRSQYPSHEVLEFSCPQGPNWRLPNQLWWDQVRFPWRARLSRADVIHVPAFSGAVIHRQPIVLTVHDLMYTKHPEWLPTRRARWYWGTWIPSTARRASAVITPSEYTKRDLVELAKVPPERVHVIAEAVDPLFLGRPATEDVQDCVSRYSGDAPYVLYVGSVDGRKDWLTFMQAFAALRTRVPEVRLVIVGHIISGRSRIHEHIQAFNLTDSVFCIGHVTDSELMQLYAGSSLFVYPSWFEGFGLPLLEAMAMGVPVISYRTSSIPEVVGEAAILIDPPFGYEDLARAMEQVLTNVSYRDALVEKGSRWVKQFSWDRVAEKTMAVYERCL
jgi:glycosyltransferase involved in cell wall biosynthesis